jgi:hypothetical protein
VKGLGFRDELPAVELQKVVSLEYHVVELEKGKGILAREAQLDRLKGHHAVDGEERAVVPDPGFRV